MKDFYCSYKNYFFIEIVLFDIFFSLVLIYLISITSLHIIVLLLIIGIIFKLVLGIIWMSFGTINWIFSNTNITIEKRVLGFVFSKFSYNKPLNTRILHDIDSNHSIGVGVKYVAKYKNVIELDFGNSKKKTFYVPNVIIAKNIIEHINLIDN